MRERPFIMIGYVYIAGTIVSTVYMQLTLKWQAIRLGPLPADLKGRLYYLFSFVTNPWIISVFLAALISLGCWTMAMTKFELNHAYPFTSLCFVLVAILSAAFFGETVTPLKGTGLLLIIAGILVGAKG
jgi:multidrug transporter EmrE-like cation transporter